MKLTWHESNGPVLWFVIQPGNQPLLQTVSYTRRGAIKHWLEVTRDTKDWNFWRRRGMHIKKVRIKWQIQP